jgi:hypothetical protein
MREEPLGKPRCRYNNIKMYLQEIEYENVDWIDLTQDRVQWQTFVNMASSL